jgi:hypothetical protein
MEAEFEKDGISAQPGLKKIAEKGSVCVFKPRLFQVFPEHPDCFGVAVQSQDTGGLTAVLDELTASASHHDDRPAGRIIDSPQVLNDLLDIRSH